MTSVNLIPSARLAQRRRRAHLRVWVVLCCGYALILAGSLAYCWTAWHCDSNSLVSQTDETSKNIKQATTSIASLRQQLAEAQAALEASKAIGSQPDWSTLLVLFGQELGDEVVLDSCELALADEGASAQSGVGGSGAPQPADTPLNRRQFKVSLNGYGQSQTSISQFLLRLERIKLFNEVKLVKSNRQPFLTGEAVAFQIDCSI